jgi:hypothetical protein
MSFSMLSSTEFDRGKSFGNQDVMKRVRKWNFSFKVERALRMLQDYIICIWYYIRCTTRSID